MADTNTSKDLNEGKLPEPLRKQMEVSLKKAAEKFEGEKLVEVSIPKNLADRIGVTLPLGINGVKIVLPVDGTKHKIPQSFADHLRDYLADVKI